MQWKGIVTEYKELGQEGENITILFRSPRGFHLLSLKNKMARLVIFIILENQQL